MVEQVSRKAVGHWRRALPRIVIHTQPDVGTDRLTLLGGRSIEPKTRDVWKASAT